MAVNLDSIAEKIMKFIRGNGLSVTMFDAESGKSVADPQAARYFYIDNPNMIVYLDDSEGVINLHVGEGLSINDMMVKKLRTNIRDMARDNTLDFDIRSFGSKIEPKNYASNIEKNKNQEEKMNDVFESVTGMEGSTRTSRQQFENSTLIVKHKAPVNEEVRGSRSRNIQSIFIENNEGERFKYPFKHLAGARAMAQHVSSGGNPMDGAGSAIVEMSTNLSKLKEFMNVVNKQRLVNETNRDVVLNVKRKMKKIKEDITRIQSSKGYTSFIESLALTEETDEQEISEDTINSYVSRFTKSTFEESLTDILPLIHRVNEEEYAANRDKLSEKVMGIITAKDNDGNKMNEIKFKECKNTVESLKHSTTNEDAGEPSKSEKLRELAKRLEVETVEDRMRKNKGHDRAAVIEMFLTDVAESLDNGKELSETQNKIVSYIESKSKVVGDKEDISEHKTIDEKFDDMINEAFDSNFKIL